MLHSIMQAKGEDQKILPLFRLWSIQTWLPLLNFPVLFFKALFSYFFVTYLQWCILVSWLDFIYIQLPALTNVLSFCYNCWYICRSFLQWKIYHLSDIHSIFGLTWRLTWTVFLTWMLVKIVWTMLVYRVTRGFTRVSFPLYLTTKQTTVFLKTLTFAAYLKFSTRMSSSALNWLFLYSTPSFTTILIKFLMIFWDSLRLRVYSLVTRYSSSSTSLLVSSMKRLAMCLVAILLMSFFCACRAKLLVLKESMVKSGLRWNKTTKQRKIFDIIGVWTLESWPQWPWSMTHQN